jgi:hypothetical protein
MIDRLDDFQLPAGFGRERLAESGRVYKDLTVRNEVIDNFEAVQRVLDPTKRPEVHEDFETCFRNLMWCAEANNAIDFYKKYDLYRQDIGFVLKLADRLMHQKIRYTFESDKPSLWSVVSVDEIVSGEEDPVVDIREADTGKKHGLFVVDIMRNLVSFKNQPFGKKVI